MILKGLVIQDLVKGTYKIDDEPISLEDAQFVKSILEEDANIKVLFGSEIKLHRTKRATSKTMQLLNIALIK